MKSYFDFISLVKMLIKGYFGSCIAKRAKIAPFLAS